MNRYLTAIAVALLITSCWNQEKSPYRIFQDYELGMTQTEFDELTDSLRRTGTLERGKCDDRSCHTFWFSFRDDTGLKSSVNSYFNREGLESLVLEIVCWSSSQLGSINRYDSNCSISIEDFDKLKQLYITKYGEPKPRYADSQLPLVWKSNMVEIQLGGFENPDTPGKIYHVEIRYAFSDQAKAIRDKERVKKNATNPSDL